MPNKTNSKQQEANQSKPPYPTNPGAYPTNGTSSGAPPPYTPAAAGQPYPVAGGAPPQPSFYPQIPPPQYGYPTNPIQQQGQFYPQQQHYNAYPQARVHPEPVHGYPHPQAPSSGQIVEVGAVFDAGARFGNGPVNVPPPPPGVAPNAAQVAAMQGHTVLGQQRKADNIFGNAGGSVFW